MRIHIIHRVTFRTVAGPYLTNRNDSYQSLSRRMCARVRTYVFTHARRWIFEDRLLGISLAATRHAFPPSSRDRSPLPYRNFRERLTTSCKSWSSMTMTTRRPRRSGRGERGRREERTTTSGQNDQARTQAERASERKSGTSEISRAADTYGSRRSAR